MTGPAIPRAMPEATASTHMGEPVPARIAATPAPAHRHEINDRSIRNRIRPPSGPLSDPTQRMSTVTYATTPAYTAPLTPNRGINTALRITPITAPLAMHAALD